MDDWENWDLNWRRSESRKSWPKSKIKQTKKKLAKWSWKSLNSSDTLIIQEMNKLFKTRK